MAKLKSKKPAKRNEAKERLQIAGLYMWANFQYSADQVSKMLEKTGPNRKQAFVEFKVTDVIIYPVNVKNISDLQGTGPSYPDYYTFVEKFKNLKYKNLFNPTKEREISFSRTNFNFIFIGGARLGYAKTKGHKGTVGGIVFWDSWDKNSKRFVTEVWDKQQGAFVKKAPPFGGVINISNLNVGSWENLLFMKHEILHILGLPDVNKGSNIMHEIKAGYGGSDLGKNPNWFISKIHNRLKKSKNP